MPPGGAGSGFPALGPAHWETLKIEITVMKKITLSNIFTNTLGTFGFALESLPEGWSLAILVVPSRPTTGNGHSSAISACRQLLGKTCDLPQKHQGGEFLIRLFNDNGVITDAQPAYSITEVYQDEFKQWLATWDSRFVSPSTTVRVGTGDKPSADRIRQQVEASFIHLSDLYASEKNRIEINNLAKRAKRSSLA